MARTSWLKGQPDGKFTRYHGNGRVATRGSLRGGAIDGPIDVRDERGSPLVRGAYRSGVRTDEWSFFHPGGGLRVRGDYRAGRAVGSWACTTPAGEAAEFGPALPDPDASQSRLVRWIIDDGLPLAPATCDPAALLARCEAALTSPEAPDSEDVSSCRLASRRRPDDAALGGAAVELLGRVDRAMDAVVEAMAWSKRFPDSPAPLASAVKWARRTERSGLAEGLEGEFASRFPDETLPEREVVAGGPSFTRVGSGFFMDGKGHVVTNAHVVQGCESAWVGRGADWTESLVVLRSVEDDLAVLAGPQSTAWLRFRATPVSIGEEVIAIGFPLGGLLSSDPTVTTGIVNSRTGLGDDPRTFQMSAGVQAGSSGGPLLDRQGAVAGVVVSRLDAGWLYRTTGDLPQNINYAIQGERLRALVQTQDWTVPVADTSAELSVADVVSTAGSAVVQVGCTP